MHVTVYSLPSINLLTSNLVTLLETIRYNFIITSAHTNMYQNQFLPFVLHRPYTEPLGCNGTHTCGCVYKDTHGLAECLHVSLYCTRVMYHACEAGYMHVGHACEAGYTRVVYHTRHSVRTYITRDACTSNHIFHVRV